MAITGTKAFTSGEILTSNDVNQYLMRGVKVFSSTAVRDAAYGGAGEPVLEEGETCYITADDELQSYDCAVWVKIGPTAAEGVTLVDSATVATLQTTTSTSFTDLGTVGPTVTMTTGTKVLLIVTCGTISPSGTSGTGHMGVAVSGASSVSASDSDCLILFSNNNVRSWALSYVYPLTVTAGSNTFTVKYKTQSGGSTSGFENRKLVVMAL